MAGRPETNSRTPSGAPSFAASARITNAGDVFFAATISGGAVVAGVQVSQGLFRCSGGNGNCSTSAGGTGTLTTVVLVNDPVPDRAGRRFCSFLDLVASDFGIAFRAVTQLDCANAVEARATGVFRWPLAGAIATVALQGEPSEPSPTAGGTVYQSFPAAPALSGLGAVAFESTTGASSRAPRSISATPPSAAHRLAFGGRIERDATPRRLWGIFVFE